MIQLDQQFSLEKTWALFFIRCGIILFLSFMTLIEHTSPYHPFKSSLVLIFLFQFSLYFPLVLSLSMVICVGLLYDLLSFSTLGGYTIFFIILKLFLENHKDYLFFKDFHYVWGIFILLLGCRMVLSHIFGWHSSLEEMIWTGVMYPLIAAFIQKIWKIGRKFSKGFAKRAYSH